jgi:hypothetical protein
MLEKLKDSQPDLKFAYLFDTSTKHKHALDPKNPQIEVLLV